MPSAWVCRRSRQTRPRACACRHLVPAPAAARRGPAHAPTAVSCPCQPPCALHAVPAPAATPRRARRMRLPTPPYVPGHRHQKRPRPAPAPASPRAMPSAWPFAGGESITLSRGLPPLIPCGHGSASSSPAASTYQKLSGVQFWVLS
ncbi:hypothetical protein EJB05_29627, partial [Eragrostis curvula]